MLTVPGAAFVLLVVASALLSAAHAAVFQVGLSRVRTLEEEGFSGAEALSEARAREVSVRSSVRIVTTALNLGALGIAAVAGVQIWGPAGSGVSVLVAIAVILIVADLIPQVFAAKNPVRVALSGAPMLLRVARWTRFLTAPVERLEDKIVRGSEDTLSTEHRELREIQEIGEEEGLLEASENRLVERAFRLDELTAWDAMVPRVDIFAWKEELALEDIVAELSTVPYSRVPVYRDSVDEVTGILYVREAYECIARGDRDMPLKELARPPFFVPGSLSLAQLLQDFQARRIHMGIVADEFGGTDGLVTLEDVLEELVGEIHDETDVDEEEIVRVSETSIECGASIDVRDLNEALDVSLPKAEHRSLNGFILEELGHVPKAGEGFERDGVRFEILEATDTQVLRVRLTSLGGATENGG